MKFWLFTSFLFLLLPAHAKELSLSQAIQFALKNSPTLKSSERELQISEFEKKNSKAAYYPSLDFSTTVSAGGEEPNVSNNTFDSSSAITLSTNIYNNGRDRNDLQVRRLTNQIEKIDHEKTRNQLILDVVKEFYDLANFKSLIQIREQRLKTLETQFRTVSKRYRGGSETRKNFLRFKAQVQRARVAVVRANGVYRRSKEKLLRLLGSKDNLSFLYPEVSHYKIDSISDRLPKVEDYYDYRQSDLTRDIRELNKERSHRDDLPQVFLNTSLSQTYADYIPNSSTSSDSSTTEWSGTLSLNYNFWDFGKGRREVAIAHANLQIAESNLQSTYLNTKELFANLRTALEENKQDYLLNKELLKLEEEAFRVIDQEYRLGKNSYLDYITALNDLLGAQISFQSAYYELKKTEADFQFHRGSIYDDWKN